MKQKMKYNPNIEFRINRYELIPKETPTNLVVSICVKDISTGKLAFFEQILELSKIANKTTAQICQEAYFLLKPQIDAFVLSLEADKGNIIGYKFIPDSNV
jgi:hypothetical protein